MKKKIFTFMFGLLLAVGWTNVAWAQSEVLAAADMQTDGVFWTYEWVDASGTTQTSPYVELNPKTNKYEAPEVTNPYQIYGLLRAVYMDTRLPGPTYSAYDAYGNRQDPVYYGAMGGGWNISKTALSDITITTTRTGTFSYSYVWLSSIIVRDANGNVVTDWDASRTFNNVGWSTSGGNVQSGNSGGRAYRYIQAATGTITIPASKLQGHTAVTVEIVTQKRNADCRLSVNGDYMYLASANTWYTKKTNVVGKNTDNDFKPAKEGYTALVVALVNDTTKIHDESNDPYGGAWEFADREEAVQYITNNFEFVKLLTDGLRIGSGENAGTVFNCDGTYNRFFFLGKGQARKKAPRMETRITSWYYPEWYCNEGPFKHMYEEFSPTTGDEGADITDFYMEMMDGKVYNVVHDCASVIQNKHQFSMAGKKGQEHKALSGLNFFIPDYRLKFWIIYSFSNSGFGPADVDGRDMNPYESVNAYGARTSQITNSQNNIYSHWSVYYAQYNQDHAPQVGVYTIHLDAEAEPTNTEHVYKVNLDWTSSLDEMSGGTVPQEYTVFIVKTDSLGNETMDTLTVTNATHFDYLVPQNEHSYTIIYQVMGTPLDSDHPGFIAWSNMDDVVIPGWNDFLNLALEHYESDFDVPKVTNWYRNFLTIDNESPEHALTTTSIDDGMNEFTLWRYDFNKPEPKTKVATLNFEVKNGGKTVDYTVEYENQLIEPVPSEDDSQYERSEMGLEDYGTLSVKGNGDIIIQPSGYEVNFFSITVRSGSTTVTSWNANQTIESRGWEATNGSFMVKDSGTNYYYLEGGGYIRIPASVLGNYTTVNVVISASRDAGKTTWIAVNEDRTVMANTAQTDYTWTNVNTTAASKAPSQAPARAGETQTVTEGFEDTNVFPTFGRGGISATQHTGSFGDWTVYDSTGSRVYGPGSTSWTDKYQPQAWTPFDNSVFSDATGHNGSAQYMESICPDNYNGFFDGPADSWLISPVLSGNAQTITFWVREFTTTYGAETFEVLYTMEEINRVNFANSVQSFIVALSSSTSSTTWQQVSVSLPEGAKYFAIRHTSDDVYGIMVDDITYEISSGETPPAPVAEGMVRLGNLPIVDQFNVSVADNKHPSRYAYVLEYKGVNAAGRDTTILSSVAEVPVQHTGAVIEGYYTLDEMDNDTDPTKFLKENMISAEIDMNLSPTSAPYYYTINSKKNGVPEDAWSNYLSRLQRRSAGDYQEMLSESDGVPNPHINDDPYPAGEYELLDYRAVVAESTEDFVTYVPIVWTTGIERRYYVDDSLHNSYGAPIWEVKRGDVNIDATVQKQTSSSGGWNPSVNWYVKNDAGTDSTAYGLYFVGFTATGILPESNIEYEPYMFRVWLVDSTQSLRNYTWEYNAQGKPLKIVDAGARPGIWFPLAEKQCNGAQDLVFQVDITNDYANNLQFAGPLNNFKPDVVARFYYKVVDQSTTPATPSGLRAQDAEDHVGYVVVKGVKPDPSTAIHEIKIVGEIVSQTYYNVQGMESDKPFDGVNIVVTRFSDGSVTTTKVVK